MKPQIMNFLQLGFLIPALPEYFFRPLHVEGAAHPAVGGGHLEHVLAGDLLALPTAMCKRFFL